MVIADQRAAVPLTISASSSAKHVVAPGNTTATPPPPSFPFLPILTQIARRMTASATYDPWHNLRREDVFLHSHILCDALQESYSAMACIYGELVLLSRWLGSTLPIWLLLWPGLPKPTNPKSPSDPIRSLGSQASRQQHVSPHICLRIKNDPKFSGSHFFYSLVP